jgi:hypothetical protein
MGVCDVPEQGGGMTDSSCTTARRVRLLRTCADGADTSPRFAEPVDDGNSRRASGRIAGKRGRDDGAVEADGDNEDSDASFMAEGDSIPIRARFLGTQSDGSDVGAAAPEGSKGDTRARTRLFEAAGRRTPEAEAGVDSILDVGGEVPMGFSRAAAIEVGRAGIVVASLVVCLLGARRRVPLSAEPPKFCEVVLVSSSSEAGLASVAANSSVGRIDERRVAGAHEGIGAEPALFFTRTTSGTHRPLDLIVDETGSCSRRSTPSCKSFCSKISSEW